MECSNVTDCDTGSHHLLSPLAAGKVPYTPTWQPLNESTQASPLVDVILFLYLIMDRPPAYHRQILQRKAYSEAVVLWVCKNKSKSS